MSTATVIYVYALTRETRFVRKVPLAILRDLHRHMHNEEWQRWTRETAQVQFEFFGMDKNHYFKLLSADDW